MTKLGVLAGTPVDTEMGVAVARAAGFATVSRYSAETPEEQSHAQILDRDGLFERTVKLCVEMADEGATGILLYCNSLACALDMPALRKRVPIKIVTPLDVYEGLAKNHASVAVLTANGQCLAAIERVFAEANPDCVVYGAGLIPVVDAIESKLPSGEIAEKYRLSELAGFLNSLGGEIILLACTHFPYLKAQLEAASSVPVVDPADNMLKLLSE